MKLPINLSTKLRKLLIKINMRLTLTLSPNLKKRVIKWGIPGLALLLIIIIIATGKDNQASSSQPEFSQVQKGNMLINIKESGYLNAVVEEKIENKITHKEVDIIEIIPDGTYVQKGDFLIELDSEPLLQQKSSLEVTINDRTFAVTDAQNNLEITQSQVQSDITLAQNKIESSNMDFKKFQKIEREKKIDESLAEINIAEDHYKMAEQTYTFSQELEAKGFETKSKVEQDKIALATKEKQLKAAKMQHEMLTKYELKQEELRLRKAVEEVLSNYERTKKQGEIKIQKAQSQLESAKHKLELANEEFTSINEQLNYTTIHSPLTGYVLYPQVPYYRQSLKIEKGKTVRRKELLMRIPDMSKMKVDISIAEHYISEIQVGQDAFITIDSIKDKQFPGKVGKVALIATDSRSSRDTGAQKYDIVIDIADGLLPVDIKPQINTSVEVILDELKDVLYIPIQAVHTVKGKRVVYIRDSNSHNYQQQEVALGKMNNSFVQIISGLSVDDQVLVSEPAA